MITSGFFNSVVSADGKGDRLYTAEQMSAIFDGLINDGVFASIGDTLVVSATTESNIVSVGTGKCWFNHTWTLNSTPLLIECPSAKDMSASQERIDAIVVEVNASDAVRNNTITYVKGTANTSPTKPDLTTSERINQHALCYIRRKAGVDTITQADIENVVGTDETPFVTGIVQVTSLDKLLGQWQQELDDFIAAGGVKLDNFITAEENDYTKWWSDMQVLMKNVADELTTWTAAEKSKIMSWFNEVKGQLGEDPAFNLQNQIDADEVERILMNGLPDGTKTISEDGTVIKTIDSNGRALVKTFTNNFLTITSVLTDREIKEYLPYPYVAFNGTTTATRYGVTFTDNGDGTVTANGTATGVIWFILPGNDFTLPQDTYVLSGCPVGGSEETYYFGASLYNNDTIVSGSAANDIGAGATLDTTDKTYTSVRIFICIKTGTTVTNLRFNPKVMTYGSELGRLVKKISADGKTIETTLTNNSEVIPNLVEIERAVDAIIANENTYISGGTGGSDGSDDSDIPPVEID